MYYKKYKNILKIILAIFLVVFVYRLYIDNTSSQTNCYDTVQEYQQENNTFYDFYYPLAYFHKEIKKEKMSEYNHVKIYYHNDPQEYYSMQFDKVYENMTLTVVVYHTNMYKEDYKLDDFSQESYLNYDLYEKENDNRLEMLACQEDFCMSLTFENIESNQKVKQIVKEMIVDAIELNH